jgi:hypothetical protein
VPFRRYFVIQLDTGIQARKAAALAENFAPVDEVADEKLKQEAKEEERNIKRICEELGVRIHEVDNTSQSALKSLMPVPLCRSTRMGIVYFQPSETNLPSSISCPQPRQTMQPSAMQHLTIFIPIRMIFFPSFPLWMGKMAQVPLPQDS